MHRLQHQLRVVSHQHRVPEGLILRQAILAGGLLSAKQLTDTAPPSTRAEGTEAIVTRGGKKISRLMVVETGSLTAGCSRMHSTVAALSDLETGRVRRDTEVQRPEGSLTSACWRLGWVATPATRQESSGAGFPPSDTHSRLRSSPARAVSVSDRRPPPSFRRPGEPGDTEIK